MVRAGISHTIIEQSRSNKASNMYENKETKLSDVNKSYCVLRLPHRAYHTSQFAMDRMHYIQYYM